MSFTSGFKRRGSVPPNGRGRTRNNPKPKWRTSDYASENTSSPRKRSMSKTTPRSVEFRNSGTINPGSDVSSPDLGVDLGSDPFSSLERSNSIPNQQSKALFICTILKMTKLTKKLYNSALLFIKRNGL